MSRRRPFPFVLALLAAVSSARAGDPPASPQPQRSPQAEEPTSPDNRPAEANSAEGSKKAALEPKAAGEERVVQEPRRNRRLSPEAGEARGVLEAASDAFTSADEWLEREVARLKAQLESLSGGGQDPLVRLAEEDAGFDWTRLGIGEETARDLAALEAEVVALRARLRLLDLEDAGRAENGSIETASALESKGLLESGETDPTAPSPDAGEQEGGGDEAAPQAESGPVRSRFPQREAVLAFLAGRIEEVLPLLEPFEQARLDDAALYVLASAYDLAGDRERARRAFEALAGREGESILRLAARRQLDRLDHLEHGVVDLGPLLKEGIER